MSKKPVLTITKFRDGEEDKYLIHSAREIQLTLLAIAKHKSIGVLYFDSEQRFFKTLLLAVNETGLWLDVGPDEEDNNFILNSADVEFVTMHQGAKVQFPCLQMQLATYASHPAFYCPLPPSMVRLQRRDYFRLPTSSDAPLKCIIAPAAEVSPHPVEVTIMDISVGGIALTCKESNVNLVEGALYPECQIELPGIGTLVVTIQVRNLFDVTSPSGVITKHAGCEFIRMDGKMSILLQRYVAMMQSKLPGIR